MDLTLLPKRHQACFRCRSYDLVSDAKAGDVVCRGCGEIQRDRIIDMTDEVRAYDDDSNKKRESRTSGRAEGGLRPSKTVFVGGSSSVAGSYCTSLNRIAEKTEQTEDRMAGILAGQIEKICNVLNLSPHLVGVADKLGVRVTQERLPSVYPSGPSSTLRRSQVQSLAASLVLLACRQEGCARTIEEVSRASGVDKSSLGKLQSSVSRDLKLPATRVSPCDLVGRLSSHSRLGPVIGMRARRICETMATYGLCQALTPQLVASSVLVLAALASREAVNVRSLAEATLSCTVLQIRKTYAQLRAHAALLLPEDVSAAYGDLAELPVSILHLPELIPASQPRASTSAKTNSIELKVEQLVAIEATVGAKRTRSS